MAFFISHVLSALGSISAQEPHVMIFLSYASTVEKKTDSYIDPLTWFPNRSSKSEKFTDVGPQI